MMFFNKVYHSDVSDDDDPQNSEIGSPSYSDRLSSDFEESLYQKIHHADDLDSTKCDELEANSFSSNLHAPIKDVSKSNLQSSRSSKDSGMVIYTPEQSTGYSQIVSFVREQPGKLSPPRESDVSVKPSAKMSMKINQEKADSLLSKLSTELFNKKTSTPFAKSAEDLSCDPTDANFLVDSCGSDGSDDVVFISSNRSKMNKKISGKKWRKREVIGCSSVQKNSNVSCKDIVSSSDSSNDVICIDSVDCSDDLMTNVGNRSENYDECPFQFNFNDSNDLDLSVNSGSTSPVFSTTNFGFEESNGVVKQSDSEAWHIDMVDKMTSFNRKMRKRYWASRCKRCNVNGHTEKRCLKQAQPKCFLCGGDHSSSVCYRKVCGLCFSFGHDRHQCKNSLNYIKCSLCKVNGHFISRCPDIWRRYHLTTTSDAITKAPSDIQDISSPIYCYNCGVGGHYGHQCKKPRLCRGSAASLPYVVSYRNPKRFMCKTSFSDAHLQMSKWTDKNSKLCQTSFKNKFMSVPSTSGSVRGKFQKKIDFAKHRKTVNSLLSGTSNFQRTPKTSLTDNDLQLLMNKKKKRKKKKKKQVNQPISQQIL